MCCFALFKQSSVLSIFKKWQLRDRVSLEESKNVSNAFIVNVKHGVYVRLCIHVNLIAYWRQRRQRHSWKPQNGFIILSPHSHFPPKRVHVMYL